MALSDFLNLPINPTVFDIVTFIFGLVVGFVLEGALGSAIYRKVTGEWPPLFGPRLSKKKTQLP
ncbi:MAG: hypothetical protein K2O24_04870 [Muribaculaceae bacterium]|nr:hypothetical protein [Muribaculaceae bacterium]